MTVASCLVVVYYWEEIKYLQNYGYPFVFIVSFLAGCSLPNPAPYIVVVFTLSTVLNPALVGAISGLAAGIGGTLIYLFGRGGRKLFPKLAILFPNTGTGTGTVARWTSRVVDWAQRRGSIVVFLMSAVFNPLFVPMALAMGTLRFRLLKFFFWCWVGNTVKSMLIAYCGYFGLGSLLRWFGMDV